MTGYEDISFEHISFDDNYVKEFLTEELYAEYETWCRAQRLEAPEFFSVREWNAEIFECMLRSYLKPILGEETE